MVYLFVVSIVYAIKYFFETKKLYAYINHQHSRHILLLKCHVVKIEFIRVFPQKYCSKMKPFVRIIKPQGLLVISSVKRPRVRYRMFKKC